MLRNGEIGHRILGFVGDDPEVVGKSLVNPTVLGMFDELPSICQRLHVDTIVVALEDGRGKLPISQLLQCRVNGVRVEESPSFYETLTGQIQVRNLRPSWLIFSPGFSKSRMLRSYKGISDFFLSLVGLVILTPLLAVSALLVWLESGGPVIYRQRRVGERGRVFFIYKLRTMTNDAEKGTGAVWTSKNGDPRITKVGRFLRVTRFDELPQLINVLKGEMSFIGPRPERPEFVKVLGKIIPYYEERHSVRPGITGWAQVKYGYGSSAEEAEIKLHYDLYYIKHMNLWLDLVILLDTVKVVLFGRGAR